MRVIYNGVEPPAPLTVPEKTGLRASLLAGKDGPLIVAVGRLAPVKAYDVLLKAFAGVDAQLRIVGGGGDRQALESLCHKLGLQDRVQFLEDRRDVSGILRAAELCVISSHREGFPLVMVEALQAGCPLISTAISGVKESLPDSLLVEPSNPEALHQLLQSTLAGLPVIRRNYSPLFLRAQKELTIDGMVQRTQDFYLELTGFPS